MPDIRPKSVSELTRDLKHLIEENFGYVWVIGEVSNCTHASSGHIYLTLKDEAAQLRAVIWRTTASRLKFDIADGMEVVASGPIEVYQARGTYQLIVEQLSPRGIGALELAFRQLHEKLSAEGLFAAERKRPLPQFPRRIALLTSPTGAAVRDMLQVITRRWRAADIVVVPVAVQGAGAAGQIAAALRMVHTLPGVDVVITGRGGGSLEDLWAFNEEVVARAIYDCRVPVISAVGHEIDVSIADLVADRRALTPSEAGELVVPQAGEVRSELNRLRGRLLSGLRERAAMARMRLDTLAERRVMLRPAERLHDLATRLDEIDAKLKRAVTRRLEAGTQQLKHFSGSLEALSPLRVLQRGYSITKFSETGEIVREAAKLQPGDRLTTLFDQGRVTSRVESVEGDVSGVAQPQPKHFTTDFTDGNGSFEKLETAHTFNGGSP
jgi:exodeoxyribonuclease VII large subunit